MASDSSHSLPEESIENPPQECDYPYLPSHESVANPIAFQINISPSPQNPTMENHDFLLNNQPRTHYNIGTNPTLENNDFLLNNQALNLRLANNFDLDRQELHDSYMQLLNAHMQLLAINSATNQQIPSGSINNNDYGGRMSMRPSNPLRHRHHTSISLQDLRGQVVAVARNQIGCKFLMRKLDEGSPQETEFILRELKGHLHDLMIDEYGTYLAQKIFKAVSVVQMDSIVNLITGNKNRFKDVCVSYHGSQAVQKLVEHLTTLEQLVDFTYALNHVTVALAKTHNGGHVIKKFLEVSPIVVSRIIWIEIASNCVEIATDKSGCTVLQNCISNANGGYMPLVEAIVAAALVLSQDPYGNYVVQYLIKKKEVRINAAIAQQLRGRYVELSANKFASNVMEDLIGYCHQDDAALIIQEIINDPGFLDVVLNPYGNYVVQSALRNSQSMRYVRIPLLNIIQLNREYLRSDPYGKRVLACAKACMFQPHILLD